MSAEEDSTEKPSFSDVVDMIEKLKNQLEEFERLKERVEANIESAGQLIPSLEEGKNRLEEDVTGKKRKIEEIGKMIVKLEDKKADLEEDTKRSQEQISQIKDQIEFISQAKKK